MVAGPVVLLTSPTKYVFVPIGAGSMTPPAMAGTAVPATTIAVAAVTRQKRSLGDTGVVLSVVSGRTRRAVPRSAETYIYQC